MASCRLAGAGGGEVPPGLLSAAEYEEFIAGEE